MHDAVEIGVVFEKPRPVGADRARIEAVCAAIELAVEQVVRHVNLAMAEGKVHSGMVDGAVLVLVAVKIQTGLKRAEAVVELGST